MKKRRACRFPKRRMLEGKCYGCRESWAMGITELIVLITSQVRVLLLLIVATFIRNGICSRL